MTKFLKNLLKVVAVIVLVIGVLFIGGAILTSMHFSDDGVYGDVVLLHEGDIHVGDVIPMVFVVPEKYSDLHKEMWDCYISENEELVGRYEYVLENGQIADNYSKAEVEAFFSQSPIDLYDGDTYTSKMALFIPEEAGDYTIAIMGYYRSTSPQGYGSLDISVLD